jgi:hypothetical protein
LGRVRPEERVSDTSVFMDAGGSEGVSIPPNCGDLPMQPVPR